MNRRKFLIRVSSSTGTILLPRWVLAKRKATSLDFFKVAHNKTGLTKKEWRLIESVQNHLFPEGPDSPGARDVNAAAYLYSSLSRADYNIFNKKRIQTGVTLIQQLSYKLYKQPFTQLTIQAQEKILRKFEKTSKGQLWLTQILEYILEALLTDPVYGGNPNNIGWKWLDHQPGFPRPPANKRYYLL